MDYKLSPGGVTRLNDDGSKTYIPMNAYGWKAYQDWQAEGNTPQPEYTPEEQIEKDKVDQKTVLLTDLQNTDKTLLKMVVALYQVLRDKSVVAKADFDTTLVDEVVALRTKLQDYENLG